MRQESSSALSISKVKLQKYLHISTSAYLIVATMSCSRPSLPLSQLRTMFIEEIIIEHKDLGHEYELLKIFATWEEREEGHSHHIDMSTWQTRERRPLAHSLFGHASGLFTYDVHKISGI